MVMAYFKDYPVMKRAKWLLVLLFPLLTACGAHHGAALIKSVPPGVEVDEKTVYRNFQAPAKEILTQPII